MKKDRRSDMKTFTRLRFGCLLLSLALILSLSACAGNVINSSPPENRTGNDGFTITEEPQMTYELPPPKTDGDISVEKALANRRSHRHFQDQALSKEQLLV